MTREQLMEYLEYNPQTGVWTWRYRPNALPGWNTRFAGKVAGSIDPQTKFNRIRFQGKLHHAHDLATLYMTGMRYDARYVNGDRTDCRWENMRRAPQKLRAA